MDTEDLKLRIGANIAAYRKLADMTQAELADRLNYSDKAISKWERGESVPDVMTLVLLAEQFGVTVNDLLAEKIPEQLEPVQPPAPPKRKADKRVIQMLTSLLVWFVALFVFVVVSAFSVPKVWIAFFYAVPVNAITLLSLRSAWRMYNRNHLLISVIVWGCLLSLYVTLLVFTPVNLWQIFLLGILGQAAVTLWFRMFRIPKEKTNG